MLNFDTLTAFIFRNNSTISTFRLQVAVVKRKWNLVNFILSTRRRGLIKINYPHSVFCFAKKHKFEEHLFGKTARWRSNLINDFSYFGGHEMLRRHESGHSSDGLLFVSIYEGQIIFKTLGSIVVKFYVHILGISCRW